MAKFLANKDTIGAVMTALSEHNQTLPASKLQEALDHLNTLIQITGDTSIKIQIEVAPKYLDYLSVVLNK